MTLIVAIACEDGIVIASDSATTDIDSMTKQQYNKIRKIGEQPILYGGSGDVGLLQKIDESLKGFMPKARLKNIRQEIRKLILPELKEAKEYHVPYPQQPFHQPPSVVLLFAGVLEGKPWILEVEKDGRDTLYDGTLGNFAAIGSGKPLAQAIFYPHHDTVRNLQLGMIFAHRIIEDSIKMSAAFLAPPIRIYTITLDGQAKEIEPDKCTEIAHTCELWRSLERETVGEILSPILEEKSPPEVPKPE